MRPALPGSQSAASEAIFGSSARGDSDALSDRDILIVDDDVEVLRTRGTQLSALGWSVASYTFRKLETMSVKGALFVQHLALEAEVERDRDDRLQGILASFSPKTEYGPELAANAQLAELASFYPAGCRGELWAADVLYVAVRNFGVLWLAERGIYRFAYDAILRELARSGAIADAAIADLVGLRFIKCLHRGGEKLRPGRVAGGVDRAIAALPPNAFPTAARPLQPADLLSCEAPEVSAAGYLVLRDLERRLIATEDALGGAPIDGKLEDLRRWIRNPRAYALTGASLAPGLRERMDRLVAGSELRIALNERRADARAHRETAAIPGGTRLC